jgi:cytosine/adenosine deaminase-related metal-dependent hydrolase
MNPEVLQAPRLLLVPELVMLPDGPARHHALLVRDGVFAEVGPAEQVLARHPELTPVRAEAHLITPGFVDTHHHLTQTFGKALAFGEPSEIFRRIWAPLEGALDEEAVYLAAKLAALEALRGGFTTVVEAGTRAEVDTDIIATATTEAGLRCVLARLCNDRDAGAPATQELLGEAVAHLHRFASRRLVHPGLAVSIPEAAAPRMLAALSRLCAESGTVFQLHVNEHLAAVERALLAHGRRPLEYLHDLGVLGPHVLAAHATLLAPAELRLLADTGTAVSYNPVASAWKGNAVAPAALMAELGIRFGIGTDATRSDAFRLLDAAESAQRLTSGLGNGDFSCGAGWTWLRHATAGGADVAGLGGLVGEIAVGKAADFLLVDLAAPELQPSWDLTWELVRLAGRDHIAAVVVDGRLRLWRGWPPDWDGPALVAQAAKIGRDIAARAPIQRVHATADSSQRRGTR